MKIGIFDSGLGGLVIAKALIKNLPQYDYLYYGDTLHLPYGDEKSKTILSYTLSAVKYLIAHDCKLIILACNTATSITLHYIQSCFIPQYAPDVKVLGVIIPTVEKAVEKNKIKIGIIATSATIKTHIYEKELLKLNPTCEITEIAAPELVPAIEHNDFYKAAEFVTHYGNHFKGCQSLILGCTHYPLLKSYFRQVLPDVSIISQDELISDKLSNYLYRHSEIEKLLSKNAKYEFKVTRLNNHFLKVANMLFPGIIVKLYES